MRVTVAGTGYVGIVTGACLAYAGHRVTCVDTDPAKIEILNSGEVPIYEPGLKELLALAKDRGLIDFSLDIAPSVRESDVIFIAVGTPPRENGEANLTFVEAVARQIGAAMDPSRYRVVINKSTVPVGCGNLVEALVRDGIAGAHREWQDSVSFGVASNPEFLREGCALSDSLYPDRIVIGTEDGRASRMLLELYRPLIEHRFASLPFVPAPHEIRSEVPVVLTSLTSAEMIKYAANAFLASKISFANEMANICERVGADARDVMTGIGLDGRIGSRFLNAGIGWGGSCFGKDVQSLLHTASDYGYQARMLQAAYDVNQTQRHTVIQKLLDALYILKGRSIALLGLAFKPDTDDLRDAPSLTIATRLLEMGARVRVYDPIAMPICHRLHPNLALTYSATAAECLAHADGAVLVTEWEEFASLNTPEIARSMARPVLIDGRNMFDADQAARNGFQYTGVGVRSRSRSAAAPAAA